jgi:hypothetical protein
MVYLILVKTSNKYYTVDKYNPINRIDLYNRLEVEGSIVVP